ncbi:MAG TPA: hypothetical protein VFT98_23085 [Myxococcota bacterium]|nr:hypothetical protein [Myxococcota bacterium]
MAARAIPARARSRSIVVVVAVSPPTAARLVIVVRSESTHLAAFTRLRGRSASRAPSAPVIVFVDEAPALVALLDAAEAAVVVVARAPAIPIAIVVVGEAPALVAVLEACGAAAAIVVVVARVPPTAAAASVVFVGEAPALVAVLEASGATALIVLVIARTPAAASILVVVPETTALVALPVRRRARAGAATLSPTHPIVGLMPSHGPLLQGSNCPCVSFGPIHDTPRADERVGLQSTCRAALGRLST